MGTTLTIDQGAGDCDTGIDGFVMCGNLSGSYAFGGYSNGPDQFSISTYAFLQDGYEDLTGVFVGGSIGGSGLIIGIAQPYDGDPVGPSMPYDPSTGQNITTAFTFGPSGGSGTFYSTSAITDNGDDTLDFSGLDVAFGEVPSSPYLGTGRASPYGGLATIDVIETGGAFGAGTYSLDFFSEDCATGEFECNGFMMHLEGSIKPVPIPPALYLFGSGLLGLIGIARKKA